MGADHQRVERSQDIVVQLGDQQVRRRSADREMENLVPQAAVKMLRSTCRRRGEKLQVPRRGHITTLGVIPAKSPAQALDGRTQTVLMMDAGGTMKQHIYILKDKRNLDPFLERLSQLGVQPRDVSLIYRNDDGVLEEQNERGTLSGNVSESELSHDAKLGAAEGLKEGSTIGLGLGAVAGIALFTALGPVGWIGLLSLTAIGGGIGALSGVGIGTLGGALNAVHDAHSEPQGQLAEVVVAGESSEPSLTEAQRLEGQNVLQAGGALVSVNLSDLQHDDLGRDLSQYTAAPM